LGKKFSKNTATPSPSHKKKSGFQELSRFIFSSEKNSKEFFRKIRKILGVGNNGEKNLISFWKFGKFFCPKKSSSSRRLPLINHSTKSPDRVVGVRTDIDFLRTVVLRAFDKDNKANSVSRPEEKEVLERSKADNLAKER
jgi:hypothetical protein